MIKNFVIGGGISGCIFAYYHPDYMLISEDIENKDNPFVFIQENIYTKKLIDDIDIDAGIDTVKINADNSDNIVKNKMIISDKRYYGTDKIANIGKNNELSVFNITEKTICEKIKKELRIRGRLLLGKVIKISRDDLVIESGSLTNKLPYTKIVSTIHFNLFKDIMPSWNPGNKHIISDLIYDVSDIDSKISSITYGNEECTKTVINSIQKKIAKEYKTTSDHKVLKMARISGKINPPPEKIIFLGRFANCNPHWRIEDSIYVAQNGTELIDIIDEQKRFDEAVKGKSDGDMDIRMQSLILGAHSELSELLEEIPYGPHKNVAKLKKINSGNVLMESIDTIKYIIAIMHEFDYTPREIYEMFFLKSKMLWDRFIYDFYGGV